MRAIIYTRHDGGISVCHPTREIFQAMQNGGYWNDRPHGFVERQIERQIGSGISQDHARRFAHAVAFGGVTEPEAWEIIRDRDCARHGALHELIDSEELPDRWFRDAWSRSANGGPVSVNLTKAKPLQWRHIYRAIVEENKRRERDLFGKRALKLNKMTWQSAINNARDDEELRRIWPEGLPQC